MVLLLVLLHNTPSAMVLGKLTKIPEGLFPLIYRLIGTHTALV